MFCPVCGAEARDQARFCPICGKQLPPKKQPAASSPTLRQRLPGGKAMPLPEALILLRQICQQLSQAHKQGLVHGNLKPEKLKLANSDAPHLLEITDFGTNEAISSTEQQTAIYLSPERLRNLPADTLADIYSVGVILFEMLTGQPPFAGTVNQVREKQQAGVPSLREYDLALPSAVDAFLSELLQVEKAYRPRSVDEVLRRLDILENSLAAGETLPSRPKPVIDLSKQGKQAAATTPRVSPYNNLPSADTRQDKIGMPANAPAKPQPADTVVLPTSSPPDNPVTNVEPPMAELPDQMMMLNVEPEQKTTSSQRIWLWLGCILLLLAIATLVYFFVLW
ncbi:MAG: protein kinase family protein [Acidobacteriota bacterium]